MNKKKSEVVLWDEAEKGELKMVTSYTLKVILIMKFYLE